MLCYCLQVQQLRISSNTIQYQTIQTHLHNGGPNFLLVIWIGKAGKSGGCGFYWVGTNCSKCVLVWRRRLPSWLALAQCTRTTHTKSQLLDHLILKSCNTQNIPRLFLLLEHIQWHGDQKFNRGFFYWMFEKTIFMRNPDSGRRVDLSWLEDLWNLNFRSEARDIFRQRQRQCKDFCKSFSWISVRETSLSMILSWQYAVEMIIKLLVSEMGG